MRQIYSAKYAVMTQFGHKFYEDTNATLQTSTLISYGGRTSPESGQHDAITKVEQGVDSKAAVLSFSVTHCFANLFLSLRLNWDSKMIFHSSCKHKRFVCKKIDLHCQSRKTADLFSHKVLASASLNLSNRID